jgi:hypothetical protein
VGIVPEPVSCGVVHLLLVAASLIHWDADQ